MILSIDVESRAVTDLIKCGAHAYWECEHADVLCAAWRMDDGQHGRWVRGDPVPEPVQAHIEAGGIVSAYNANFERLAFIHVLGPKHGWPVPRLEQWDDTAAMAAAMGLPRALGQAAAAMGLEVQKDDAGKRLIRKFSIPRKARKGEAPGRLYWNEPEDHPEDFEAFVAYCETDVVVERALRDVLVPLSEAETAVWRFDARMNDRGIRLDRALVEAMLKIVERAKGRLDKAMAEATGWEVTAASQVSALTAWLVARGVPAESLAKDLLDELLALTDLPDDARAALQIRKEAAKASTAKLGKMLQQVQRDSRVRGQVLYHGAATGRWSGKGIQVQNLPRGSGVVKNPDTAAKHMLGGSADLVDMLYGAPMSAVSDMLRACFTASPGHRLIAADYSSIEGRGTAWLAGEDWKIEAFNATDRKAGPGIYELTASKIYGVRVDGVSKGQRQVGKTAELGLGYQGGVMAFHSMARIYGVDMAQAYEPLRRVADGETWDRAIHRYEECLERKDTGTDILTYEAWIASEVTKVMWRAEHPATVALWHGLEDAAREATLDPGTVQTYGRIAFTVRKNFLWMRLPSGRCIAYGAPRVKDEETPWGGSRKAVSALGVNSTTNKWERHGLYGGILTNNAVQGLARDLMAHGMLNADKAGYPIVLTVHDEAVADVEEGFGSLAEFERLLCDKPAWAEGLPLVADGWEGQRYRK
jgi:DNA polymerase